MRVAIAQHLGEGHDLHFATAALGGLLVVTLGADIFDDVFALELLLRRRRARSTGSFLRILISMGMMESDAGFGGKAEK